MDELLSLRGWRRGAGGLLSLSKSEDLSYSDLTRDKGPTNTPDQGYSYTGAANTARYFHFFHVHPLWIHVHFVGNSKSNDNNYEDYKKCIFHQLPGR